MKEKKSKVDT